MEGLFVTCPENIEPLLFRELKELGVADLNVGHFGVFAKKDLKTVYTINYCSRLATRVLWPLSQFRCFDAKALYEASSKIPWDLWIKEGDTFAIDANVSHQGLRSSLYAAQVMKDGICDQIRQIRGSRPSVDVKNPTIQLHLYIHNQRGIISFDTSGAPLFKRGWRQGVAVASIQENLAAALLLHTGYRGGAFCDPLCGSGTFLVEAMMIATKTPPGFLRKEWGFFHHPQYQADAFNAVKEVAHRLRVPLNPSQIQGADRDLECVKMSRDALALFDCQEGAHVESVSVSRYRPTPPLGLILTNPPFGKRIEIEEKLFGELGSFLLKNQGTYKKAAFLSPDPKPLQRMGVPLERTLTFSHGGLRTHLFETT